MYVVVKITKNLEGYPECKEDTEKYPHLVKYVGDEMDIFIVKADDPEQFWPAGEFFYMVEIKGFVEAAEMGFIG